MLVPDSPTLATVVEAMSFVTLEIFIQIVSIIHGQSPATPKLSGHHWLTKKKASNFWIL